MVASLTWPPSLPARQFRVTCGLIGWKNQIGWRLNRPHKPVNASKLQKSFSQYYDLAVIGRIGCALAHGLPAPIRCRKASGTACDNLRATWWMVS
jgi:hypothetical protein